MTDFCQSHMLPRIYDTNCQVKVCIHACVEVYLCIIIIYSCILYNTVFMNALIAY